MATSSSAKRKATWFGDAARWATARHHDALSCAGCLSLGNGWRHGASVATVAAFV